MTDPEHLLGRGPVEHPASLNVDSDLKCVPIIENSVYFLQSPLLVIKECVRGPPPQKVVRPSGVHGNPDSDPSSWPHYKEHLFTLKGSVWDHTNTWPLYAEYNLRHCCEEQTIYYRGELCQR